MNEKYILGTIYWVFDENLKSFFPAILNMDNTKIKNLYTNKIYDKITLKKNEIVLDKDQKFLIFSTQQMLKKFMYCVFTLRLLKKLEKKIVNQNKKFNEILNEYCNEQFVDIDFIKKLDKYFKKQLLEKLKEKKLEERNKEKVKKIMEQTQNF